MTLALRKQGISIESITIGAGIPSPDTADEIIAQCQEAGPLFITFKPGSMSAIEQVIGIAERNPTFPIVAQWTGGRAGGHHSFEDMHDPNLQTYSKLRACDNIVLVGGSGIGNGKQAQPYFDGSWSLPYGYPCMPFDAVLMNSCMMVAKEAATASSSQRH
eukprot:TRINITY_DN12641_c0_g1_i3.p3 TRINITY_DN12641_c0_g1~~TRINITY_DN12641_c0_g1_i3.p3  ORF type:complete len:160 (+),score=39.41 TRINITY_DN12641_c0_g1_i3:1728-2207(+)